MKWSFIFIFCFYLISIYSQAQSPQPEVKKIDQKSAAKIIFLNPEYLAYLPKIYKSTDKVPLVIYLHGGGGVGKEINKIRGQVSRVSQAIQRFNKGPCLVIAPQCQRESKKSDQRGVWEPSDLNIFLAHLLESYPYADANRVYLTGNSMGGYGSWVWGGHSPEKLAAIAPIVGGIGRGGPKDVTPDLEKWAANLAKVPVWAFAGAKDKVVPAERSERMVAAIKKAGGKSAKLTVYPEEGHGASKKVLASEEFFEWLFNQKRQTKAE